VARQAERETLSYERYLHEVVQRECDERLENKTAKMLRSLSCRWKIAGNVRCPALPPKQPADANAAGRWFLERTENVLVFGNLGAARRTCSRRSARN